MFVSTVFIIIITPYQRQIDNVRLIINRVLLLILVSIQVYIKTAIAQNKTSTNFINAYFWIISSILIVGAFMNGTYIIWKTMQWFKKPGEIDMKLFVLQKGTLKKPVGIDYVPNIKGLSFPKLEFGIGYFRRKER